MRARVSARAVIALVFLAACTGRVTPVTGPSVTPTSPASSHTPQTPSTLNATATSARPGTLATRPPSTSSPYDDEGEVGAMARQYLRAEPARRLLVEITYVQGRKPSGAAIDHLVTILRREALKPGGVTVAEDAPIPAEADHYSTAKIAQMEERYRHSHSSGGTATIWLVFLNGDSSEASGTLGLAFRASAASVFEDQVAASANAFVSAAAIERAVVTHEAGHLLGLVNLGYRSAYDHEDPQHPHHSRYRSSVMYWAIEDASIAAILSGGPPDDFDRYDRADLAQLRG
ncbi:MAG: hypothetical protein ACXVQY_02745 [Actinomycetota bacterium]